MRTQYYTASSLDGYIATVDHSLEWLFQLGDVNQTSYPDFIREVGALCHATRTLFINEATQPVGKVPEDVEPDHDDLLCLSAHKN